MSDTQSTKIVTFPDGYAVLGDSTSRELQKTVYDLIGPVGLIVADPPYGNIVDEKWDCFEQGVGAFAAWMLGWTYGWQGVLQDGGAFYVWGGIGTPGFRPFLKYLSEAERVGEFELANLITWKKKRAYGLTHNYLFTREECAYFTKGPAKKPRKFNIPLLDNKRGYAGYNAKYPAKSEYYRRTNVWTDVTEIMRGKLHPTQKTQKLHEIMIEIHTDPGEYVIDPFGGACTTAFAARKLGRKFLVVEQDETYFNEAVSRLSDVKSATDVIKLVIWKKSIHPFYPKLSMLLKKQSCRKLIQNLIGAKITRSTCVSCCIILHVMQILLCLVKIG